MKKILAIGPHPDDIELGCFGTMARLKQEGNQVSFLVLTDGSGGTSGLDRKKEAQDAADLIQVPVFIESLHDRYISEGYETIKVIEKYINELHPDIVFIPSKEDTHQDHRAVHHAAIVATRLVDEVYIYQSPSSNINFRPTYYVDITDYMDLKIQAVKFHTSQNTKTYMADRAVQGLAEYRAFDIFRNDRLFEAFEVFRSVK
ncbi:MAG: hypothetical protein DLD55_01970 [candidate division SR1 bacterium]|nr:MAG: hypothetical protein DLD55_01970 [candidate division SR1 bacterium]